MGGYKLTYFNGRGIGEPIRLLFHYVGEKFEDERLVFENFASYKPKTKYGHLPELHLGDGRKLYDSAAIGHFLGKKYGLSGKDDFEEAQVLEILNFHKDVAMGVKNFVRSCFPMFPEEAPNKEQYKVVALQILKTNLPFYEKLLQDSGSGYLLPSGITYVDFFVVESFLMINNLLPEAFENHPKLTEYRKRVHTHPKIKDYVENRPKTAF